VAQPQRPYPRHGEVISARSLGDRFPAGCTFRRKLVLGAGPPPRSSPLSSSDPGSPVGNRALRTRTAYSRSLPGLRARPIRKRRLRLHAVVARLSAAAVGGRQRRRAKAKSRNRSLIARGTGSSNPSPSSGESLANLIRGSGNGMGRREASGSTAGTPRRCERHRTFPRRHAHLVSARR